MELLENQTWINKQINSDAFYLSIEEIFAGFGPPYGAADNKIIPNGLFWSSLAINTLLRSREYSNNPTQNECSNKEEVTQYSYLHNESTLLMLGIMVLSWLKINLKKKTENGHCHNPIHRTTKTSLPANCPIGSNFHSKLYSNYVSILEDLLRDIKSSTPTAIASPS
jgi:hypothetical protein